jgi:hypothetical protein
MSGLFFFHRNHQYEPEIHAREHLQLTLAERQAMFSPQLFPGPAPERQVR